MASFDKKICVVGLGYIGLPTASLLATRGYDVLGIDIDPGIVETINKGELHIYEPDLDVLVRSAVQSGKLVAATEPAPADIFIIAVPTPFKDGHAPDLSYVEAASRAIAPHVQPGNLVILESTSPVGATELMQTWICEAAGGLEPGDFFTVHSPERVLPGKVLQELVVNDRIVGGLDPASAEAGAAFYRTFTTGQVRTTDARTAELSKLAENAFRDVNIAYANELSLICDRLSIDVWELIELANRHPRVNILQPGPGVGGHCIAVDPWFIVDSAPGESALIRTARAVNDGKPAWVLNKVREALAGVANPSVACLGLAFKANIDDLRESPALAIVEALAAERVAKLLVAEPYIRQLPASLAGADAVELADVERAVAEADVVLVLVDHDQFREISLAELAGKTLIDTRGLLRGN